MNQDEGSIEFTFDARNRRRIAIWRGTIGDAEMLAAYEELARSPDFDPAADDLADLRAVKAMNTTQDGFRKLMAMFFPFDALRIPTRLAIVAVSDLVFGMSRMYELLRGDEVSEEIRVFRNYDEALAWLDDPDRARKDTA
jgi:hypothetical protein